MPPGPPSSRSTVSVRSRRVRGGGHREVAGPAERGPAAVAPRRTSRCGKLRSSREVRQVIVGAAVLRRAQGGGRGRGVIRRRTCTPGLQAEESARCKSSPVRGRERRRRTWRSQPPQLCPDRLSRPPHRPGVCSLQGSNGKAVSPWRTRQRPHPHTRSAGRCPL